MYTPGGVHGGIIKTGQYLEKILKQENGQTS